MSSINVENKDLKAAPGVELNEQQKTIIGSVLDLFAGKPSKEKLALWKDDATFEDPICIAKGRKQYEAQWYGLLAVFSDIEQQEHLVKSVGNPIEVHMKSRYVVKGIGKEQVIASEVNIFTDGEGKIEKVQDKWDGKLPDGPIVNAFRKLNAVTVPNLVSVPKE